MQGIQQLEKHHLAMIPSLLLPYISLKESMIYVYIHLRIYIYKYNLYSYISILITHLDKSNTSSKMFISYETAWFPNSLDFDLPVAFCAISS